MEKKPIAQLINLKKKIGNKMIIDDVTVDIFPGEVFGFLGPNGAGKTTTIRMMVGLVGITEGEVTINGFSIRNEFETALQYVGGIIENPEMYKFMSGYRNLIHYARMFPKKISKQRIDEIVKLVGLEHRIHEKVSHYSLGMRQRLGVAQALLHSPALLILDEPTNGLDPAGIREIRNYIRKIVQEENIAVFVSSHILAEMQLMCDRIGIIHHGKLIRVESVRDMVGETEQTSVTFEVEPVQEAERIIKQMLPQTKVTMTNQHIEMTLYRKEIPAIVSALVTKDMNIFAINAKRQTLEDKFLDMTGGDR